MADRVVERQVETTEAPRDTVVVDRDRPVERRSNTGVVVGLVVLLIILLLLIFGRGLFSSGGSGGSSGGTSGGGASGSTPSVSYPSNR